MHAADLLSQRASISPHKRALIDHHTGVDYTYEEINTRSNRMAHWLSNRYGIQKGDRVSILAYNSIHYLDMFFGSGKIGAIFAPLNWRLSAAELVYIVKDLEPHVLLYGPEFTHVIDEMRPQINVPYLFGIEGASIEPLSSLERTLLEESGHEPTRPPLSADDPYCILYTSGTTGHPKGAVLPHRQILWNCINTVISWGLGERDVSPIFTPLFHAGGLFAFMTPILYAGGTVVLTRHFDVAESLKTIVDYGCTVILGVPTLFQMWRDADTYANADLSRVHFFISGGAPCPVDLMTAWRQEKGVIFRQGYGLTEVGPNCFTMTDAESIPKSGSVGKPIYHSRMRLVDPETGAEMGEGELGELQISGPHVCTGYWRNPDAAAAALIPSADQSWPWPWFRTGDMAGRDEDGFYRIGGRFKDMIISGGENIYAAEVEAIVRGHPAVIDCALIGKPDVTWGEVGLMIVAVQPHTEVTAAQLRAYCDAQLARYKIPKEFVFTDSLPYSPYGKVIKSELRRIHLP